MTLTAQQIAQQISTEQPRLTGLRAIAAAHGKDPATAQALWQMGSCKERLVALLMMDPRQLTPEQVEQLTDDIIAGPAADREQVGDWMLTNVLIKRPPLLQALSTWQTCPQLLRQRLFWYMSMRTSKNMPAAEQDRLVSILEQEFATADPSVQWTMNLFAGQVGIQNPNVRARCIALGERTGLYKDYPTPKGCTSPYLPLWINAIVARGETA